MKTQIRTTGLILAFAMLTAFNGFTQENGFVLTPSGTTTEFMKFIPAIEQYNGKNYVTGYLTLSAFKEQFGNYYDPGIPVQKLQLQGGNIILYRNFNAGFSPDFNPTSQNGAVLFSDYINTFYKHGKWGIEYENKSSTGGLNFFKPESQLTSSRINFNLFLSNNGNVGIGSGDPVAKFQVKDGDIFIEDINRGIIMKSPDGNCWRGVLNNQGQLEFILLPDCLATSSSSPDMNQKPGINIVPNPASGSLQIHCTDEDLNTFSSYKMLDSSGKEAKAGSLNNTSLQLDIQNLSSGIYFLQFYGKGAFWTEKVVVQ